MSNFKNFEDRLLGSGSCRGSVSAMTLTMAWLRAQRTVEKLVVASDSRLRGGYAWDTAPKILPLARDDAVLAFAGSTDYAYPLMLQVANAVQQYEPARNRAQKLEDFHGHMVRVMNGMLEQVSDASARLLPDALFILAGYSWRYDTWRIWTIRFDRRSGRFASHAAERWRGGHDRKVLAIVGDSVDSARSRLIELLRAEKHLSSGGFDWEPLRILVSMIGDGRFPSIGGPPQVVKVYKHLRVQPFAVQWPRADGTIGAAFMGRPLLDYEVPNVPILSMDPASGRPL
jgi:hypothetical protein